MEESAMVDSPRLRRQRLDVNPIETAPSVLRVVRNATKDFRFPGVYYWHDQRISYGAIKQSSTKRDHSHGRIHWPIWASKWITDIIPHLWNAARSAGRVVVWSPPKVMIRGIKFLVVDFAARLATIWLLLVHGRQLALSGDWQPHPVRLLELRQGNWIVQPC